MDSVVEKMIDNANIDIDQARHYYIVSITCPYQDNVVLQGKHRRKRSAKIDALRALGRHINHEHKPWMWFECAKCGSKIYNVQFAGFMRHMKQKHKCNPRRPIAHAKENPRH